MGTPPHRGGWEPNADERADENEYPTPLGEAGRDKLVVRLVHDGSDRMVEFAMNQVTWYQGAWRDVFEIDSKHGSVHSHRYVRSTLRRVGEPEVLAPLTCKGDVQAYYDQALQRMMDDWRGRRGRWDGG